jgi:hypothetical protein
MDGSCSSDWESRRIHNFSGETSETMKDNIKMYLGL